MAAISSILSLEDGTTQEKTHISPPALRLIHTSQGFCGPHPDFSDGHTGELVAVGGGALIVKISPHLVVKYGPHVKVTEAESLLYIQEKAPGIPAPRLYACYTIGPFDRDPTDFGSVYDTYIIMTFVEGRRLDEAWHDLDSIQKTAVAAQLRSYMQELRSISLGTQLKIGSVTNGPLQDPILAYHSSQGPFADEAEFNAALVSVHEDAVSKAHLRSLIEGALAENKHTVVLTHGDLQGRNIIVAGDKVVALVDWETCGWYPEYWEFAKCFSVAGWPKDWPNFVSQVLEPYYHQWAVYDMIKRHVW